MSTDRIDGRSASTVTNKVSKTAKQTSGKTSAVLRAGLGPRPPLAPPIPFIPCIPSCTAPPAAIAVGAAAADDDEDEDDAADGKEEEEEEGHNLLVTGSRKDG